MKIAIIGLRRSPICQPYLGGTEKFIYELSKSLTKFNNKVSVYCAPGSSIPSVKSLIIPTTSIIDNSVDAPTKNMILDTIHYKEIAYEIKKGEYDIIIDSSLKDGFLHFAPFFEIPIIKLHHIPPAEEVLESIYLEQKYSNKVFHVFVSNFLKSQFSNIHYYKVIHNGIDPDIWVYNGQKLNYLMWSGRILPDKGTHFAVQAAKKLDIPLILAGSISDQKYFDEQVKPYLNEKIQYKGNLNPDELSYYVSRAKCTLFTSVWNEPFGYVLAESLTAGTPVAGFNKGASSELISSKVGALTNSFTTDGLIEAIGIATTKNPMDCVELAQEKFTLSRMSESYLKLIHDLTYEKNKHSNHKLQPIKVTSQPNRAIKINTAA